MGDGGGKFGVFVLQRASRTWERTFKRGVRVRRGRVVRVVVVVLLVVEEDNLFVGSDPVVEKGAICKVIVPLQKDGQDEVR